MNVSLTFLLGIALAGSVLLGQDSQTVTLDHKVQIPGAVLKSGEYTFAVEDRLQDRAIIRITNTKKNSHELVLAVPSDKLNQAEHGKLIFFSAANSDKQILQGWMCPSCQTALEVVYPKNDAVKITGETAKAVLAVDPTYDKLPKNLTPDDMKVVTLWLLSPKEITPEQKGKGVEAAKYADVRSKQNTQVASVPPHPETKAVTTDNTTQTAVDRAVAPPPPDASATTNGNTVASAPVSSSAVGSPVPAPSPVTGNSSATAEPVKAPEPLVLKADHQEMATADAKPAAARSLNTPTQVASARRMPHTASNTYNFALIGLMLLLAGAGSCVQRRFFPKLMGVKR